MIYFTIPDILGVNPAPITVYLDRNPSATSTLSLHETSNPTGVSQTAPNGINIRSETSSFTKTNIPVATLEIIDYYFRTLDSRNLTITYPEGNKNYLLTDWQISLINSLYGMITFNVELMYL